MLASRTTLLLLHRWVGLALAALLVCEGLTGSVIVFDDALDAWLNPDLFDVAARPGLPPQELIDRIEAQRPQASVSYIIDRPPPGRAAVAFLSPRGGAPLAEDEIFADPATGRVLGGRLYGGCCVSRRVLIPFIYRIHDSLALGVFGQWLLGAVAIAWALDCINGFLLTLPPHLVSRRQIALKQWRLAWTISLARGGIRRLFDLHRAVSLWLWVVLFGIAISGISLTLPRSFEGVVAYLLPVQGAADDPPAADARQPGNLDRMEDAAWHAARAAGWQGGRPSGLFRFGGTTTFYFSQDGTTRGAGFGPWHVRIDASGRTQVLHPGTGRAGDVVLALQLPWHDGRLIGLPGRILVAVSGVATAMLSVTGVLIWWRKRRSRLSMARRRLAGSGDALGKRRKSDHSVKRLTLTE